MRGRRRDIGKGSFATARKPRHVMSICASLIVIASMLISMAQPSNAATSGTASLVFSLGFDYGGSAYFADIYGDAADYTTIRAQQAGNGAAAAEATYLVGAVNGGQPLYAISVFPGVPGNQTGSEITGLQRSAMLAQVFTWAYVYTTIYIPDRTTPNSTGAETFVTALEEGPISNQWEQQVGINAAAVLNLLTVIGPIASGLDDTLGDQGAQQTIDAMQVVANIVEDNAEGQFATEWSSITSTLASDGLIASASQPFTGPQFLQALEAYPSSDLPALISTLYSAAYPGQTPVPYNVAQTVEESLLDMFQSGAIESGEIYFGADASLTSALSAGVAAAGEDLVNEEIPFALASFLNQTFVQPEAYALQEEVNLQDIEVSLYSQFEDARQGLGYDTASDISLDTANELFDIDGLMLSFGAQWATVDDGLVQSETLRCDVLNLAPVTCADQEATDQSYENGLEASIPVLESFQSKVQGLLGTLPTDPLAITTSATLPAALVDQPYSVVLGASGGSGSNTWSAPSGLPAWLTLSSSGVLSGTPTSTATSSIKVQVTDSTNPAQVVTKTFTVTVAPDILKITTTSLPVAVAGASYSATLEAVGGTPSYSWTSTGLPTGLSLSSEGVISGTPTTSGTTPVTFTVTDSGIPTPQHSSSTLDLTVAPGTLAITTSSLPNAVTGLGYFADLDAQGGVTPYHWSVVSGTLPPGTTLGAVNSVVGDIAGVPSQTGTYSFTIEVTDSESPSVSTTQNLSITVNPAPLVIATTSLATATQGDPYTANITTTGGTLPLAFAVSKGSPPQGLSLNSASGVLSGVPTKPGSYSFSATVTDSGTPVQSASINYVLVVLPHPLAITTGYLPTAFAGDGYNAGVSAGWGAGPYTWKITSGSLPSGLTFSASNGAISGSPATVGTRHLTFEVTDSESPPVIATRSLILSVLPASDMLTPQPMAADSPSGDTVSGVSCPTTSWCMSVGRSSYGVPLFEKYSGGYWTVLPGISGVTTGQLSGLSCVTTKFCMAVGTSTQTGNNETLVAEWNGSSWSLVTSPNEEVNGIPSSLANFLTSVSCTSTSFCMAVGDYTAPTSGTLTDLGESWNGSSWSLLSPPTLGVGGTLTGVSCTGGGMFCAATGIYYPGGNSVQTGLLMTWSGGSWTTTSGLASVWSMSAVSCVSLTSCTAVGESLAPPIDGSSSDYPTGFVWNGSAWNQTMSTFADDGLFGGLSGISCSSATSCEAVGLNYDNGGDGGSLVLYERNGVWSATASPSTSGSLLASISCLGSFCTAVGQLGSEPLADVTGPAPAPGIAPVVKSFAVTPASFNANGGELTFTWSTKHATACVITSTPSLPDLPTDVPCSSDSGSVTVPANTQSSAVDYGFSLDAIGVGGTTTATANAGPVTESEPSGFPVAWSEVSLPGGSTDSNAGNAACVSATQCSISGLTSGNQNAVWTTTNSGVNWNESVVPNTSRGSPSCQVNGSGPCLVVAGPNNFYMIGYASSQQNTYLWVSSNAGGSWSQVPLPDSSYDSSVQMSCTGPTTCYLVTGASNVYETTDGGFDWASIGSNLSSIFTGVPVLLTCPSSSDCLLAGAGGGVYVTTDGGTTWSQTSTANVRQLECLGTTNCILATGSQLEFSSDGGLTWGGTETAPIGIQAFSCPSVTTCVITDGFSLYSTTDGGQTWTNDTPQSAPAEILTIVMPNSDGPIYVNGLDGQTGQYSAWVGTPIGS